METDKLAEALERFINAEDWDEDRTIAEQTPALLSDEAQRMLAENIADYRLADRDDVAEYLEEHRSILQRSREVGVQQAFEEAEKRSRESQEARQRQLSELRPPKPAGVEGAVWRLLDAETPEQVDEILSQNPELTSSEQALAYLDSLVRRAQAGGQSEALRYLREYHELLRTFFELPPVMRALQEFMSAPTWGESRDILKKHPDLLTNEALGTMDSLSEEARKQGDEMTLQALQGYRRVLERAREVGPDAAIEEIAQPEEPHQAR